MTLHRPTPKDAYRANAHRPRFSSHREGAEAVPPLAKAPLGSFLGREEVWNYDRFLVEIPDEEDPGNWERVDDERFVMVRDGREGA